MNNCHELVEQAMRMLRQKMSKAAWAATCSEIEKFLYALSESNQVWFMPSILAELADRLELKERDRLFREVVRFGRPMNSGGYHLEQVLNRPRVLAVVLTVFLNVREGAAVLRRPPVVDA